LNVQLNLLKQKKITNQSKGTTAKICYP